MDKEQDDFEKYLKTTEGQIFKKAYLCGYEMGYKARAVREMSVEEVAEILFEHIDTPMRDALVAAKALSKLGTIRVVEG